MLGKANELRIAADGGSSREETRGDHHRALTVTLLAFWKTNADYQPLRQTA
ncbi:MAG TPA: hypothetical protein VGM64_07440 [Lacunisphaera sp.]|jgi:hypothetical protein